MNDSKLNKTTTKEQTKKMFLKHIKELDATEQELLLKLYAKIIEDMK